jgi:hypothetical protein
MPKKLSKFDPDFDDVDDIESLLKEFELSMPDEDDAFFGIELESLEEYLEKVKVKTNKKWTK